MAGSGGWYQNAEEFKQSLLEWDADYRNEMINRCGEDFKVNYSVEKTISYDEGRVKCRSILLGKRL